MSFKNEALQAWILLVASHTTPARIRWCDGSDGELSELCAELASRGVLKRLHAGRFPNCFLHRCAARDAERPERLRLVCAPHAADVGPTNRWISEEGAHRLVWPLFANAMKGKTLFVAPYLLGPPGSRHAQVGVQLTDSPLAVVQLSLLTRMGRTALDHLGRSSDFVRGLHSSSQPGAGAGCVVHFPATQTCWSIGSDDAEAAVFGGKWHALNMASARAPEEGFLAEHMSVARVTTPSGLTFHVAAGFPSGCGKTQLARLTPTLPRWSVELVADGLCFLRVGDDGRLWALNAAAGVDDRIVGTSDDFRAHEHAGVHRDAIFTNVALARDGTPWWEGCDRPPRAGIVDWQGRPWTPELSRPAAHPEARCMAPAEQYSGVSRAFFDPQGVPLAAILFGGRRSSLAPLIFEATSWEHGVYVGATSRSEAPPGGAGGGGALRHDPMGMLPYCAYNMADYFRHWLSLGRQLRFRPRIFHVNWFRAHASGQPIWPGFGENVRVLQWIAGRIESSVDVRRTALGLLPRSLDMKGLDLAPEDIERLLRVDVGGWLEETQVTEQFFSSFGERLPAALLREHEALVRRLRDCMN